MAPRCGISGDHKNGPLSDFMKKTVSYHYIMQNKYRIVKNIHFARNMIFPEFFYLTEFGAFSC